MQSFRRFGISLSLCLVAACGGANKPPENTATSESEATASGNSSGATQDDKQAGSKAMPVEPSKGPAADTKINPFADAQFYVNPDYTKKVEAAAAATPALAAKIK